MKFRTKISEIREISGQIFQDKPLRTKNKDDGQWT